MEKEAIRKTLESAVRLVLERDTILLIQDTAERCIAARLAFYLQQAVPDFTVDVEYNRDGVEPKRLGVPEEYANSVTPEKWPCVTPDIIIHERGKSGQNLLVLELKKSTNGEDRKLDQHRINAFKKFYGYKVGACLECITGNTLKPGIKIIWI